MSAPHLDPLAAADAAWEAQRHAAQAAAPIANGHNPAAPSWPPPLGSAAYHGTAGDFVRLVLPQTEADPAALLFHFLATAGNCFGDRAYFLVEQTRHYPNLFTVIAGDTAKARKGTAARWVARIFAEADPKWQADCTAGGLSTGEGLIERVRDPAYETNRKTGDLELIDPGIADKQLLITEEEFSRPIRVMGRSDNTLAAILRSAWDGGRLSIMTRNRPIKAGGATISIIAHITIPEIRAELTEIQAVNGFANRFLFAVATRSKLLPFGGEVGAGDLSAIAARVRDAVQQCPAGAIRFDEGARKLWHAAYFKLSEAAPGLHGAITARAEAQAVRVALIYALLDGESEIQVAHLEAALEIIRFAADSVFHIFGDATGNRTADTIHRALKESAGLTRTDLSNLFGRNVRADELSAALCLLVQTSKIHSTRTSTAGRPAEMWHAGP